MTHRTTSETLIRSTRMRAVRHALWLPIALLAACATQTPVSQQAQEPAPQTIESTSASPETAAPAPRAESPAETALRTLAADQDRLYRVAAPLLVKNADLCKSDARNLLGFTAKTRFSYSADFVEAAQSVLGLEDRLKITGVLPDSGAARAGVAVGDLLVSVENKPMPKGPGSERQAAVILGPLVATRPALKLGLIHDGNPRQVNVPLTRACAFGIELGNADHVNSYADGRRILMTRGMLNFVRNDNELAYVIAREMAQSVLGHARQQRMTATIDSVVDNLIRMHPDLSTMSGTAGIRAYPEEMDVAADRLGLYMAARGGYPVDGAAAFWQRLAGTYPATVQNGYTAIHPATAARIAAIQQTVAAIKTKQAEHKPLTP